MTEDPRTDTLTRAIKTLTVAIWCLCALVLAQLAFYGWSYVRSMRWAREAMAGTSSSQSGPSGTLGAESAKEKPFHELPPEELIKRSSAILLTKYQKDGERLKAVVVEILKKQPNTDLFYKVGDEFTLHSRWARENTEYGDGEIIFLTGSPASMRSSYSYRSGRIAGLGDMPLDRLREMISREDGATPRLGTPLPRSAALAVTPVPPAHREDLIKLESTTNGEGVTREFSISRSSALKIPEWLPEKGEPPLGMAKAISLATEAAQAQSPEHTVFVARALRIQPVSCDEPLGNRWYYVLACIPRVGGGLGMGSSVPVVILMDGTVVTSQIKNG